MENSFICQHFDLVRNNTGLGFKQCDFFKEYSLCDLWLFIFHRTYNCSCINPMVK